MDKIKGEERILLALKNKKAFGFAKKAFVIHYRRNFKKYSEQAISLVNEASDLLAKSQEEGESFIKLESAVIYIYTHLFKKDDESFWFNKMYLNYKKNIRPKMEFSEINSYLQGKKILDFGSGPTCFALELKKHGYKIQAVDILDYRFPETKDVPFMKLQSPAILNSIDKSIDTIVVKAVLHHINSNYLIPVLKELRRVGKRLIIEESVFGIKKEEKDVKELIKKQPLFEQFLSLSLGEQYSALIIIDFFANVLALGNTEINLPFEQKTLSEWKKILADLNFKLINTVILGVGIERVTPDSRVIFICDTV